MSVASRTSVGFPFHPATGTCPVVSVVIVNYNGKHYLDDCLHALETQTYPRDQFEVVLVDNGSQDGSVEHVRQHYPWVRLTALDRNLGFAGGNNEGFRQAHGELIALLNNDTVVDRHWLAELVASLSEDERIGMVTSKILFKHDPTRINNVGLLLYADGHGADRGFRQPDAGQFDEPADVFGACGASLLLRRQLLRDVGDFDERLFMYYEDLDLAWRARIRGWNIRYAPRSVVYHVHCGSSGEWSPFFLYYVERNRVLVNAKNAPPRQAFRVLASFCWRTLRKCFRVLVMKDRTPLDRAHAMAYLRALASLGLELPLALVKRISIRLLRRNVPDTRFAHLVDPPPVKR